MDNDAGDKDADKERNEGMQKDNWVCLVDLFLVFDTSFVEEK